MTEDIDGILNTWPYESGEITVRKIVGRDGRPRVQMRLDLGLLQMEMAGRPDGKRPHGAESLLDYHRARLEEHRRRHKTEAGFSIPGDECARLREESVQYYHRYLSLYHLEEFEQVVADTTRNLECLDFLKDYAADEGDRLGFQQYRPYIIMMRSRALAALALKAEDYDQAMGGIEDGISEIEQFLDAVDQPELAERSIEIGSLRRLGAEIRRRRPLDPIDQLREDLQAAVSAEDYERAAMLRDRLRDLEISP